MSPGLLQASQFYLLNGVSVLFEEIPLLEPPTSPSVLPIARPPHLPAAPGGSPAPLPPAAARRAQTRSPNRGPPPRSRRARCPSCSGSQCPALQPCQGAKSLKVTLQPSARPCSTNYFEGGCLYPRGGVWASSRCIIHSTKGIIISVPAN